MRLGKTEGAKNAQPVLDPCTKWPSLVPENIASYTLAVDFI